MLKGVRVLRELIRLKHLKGLELFMCIKGLIGY